MLQDQTHLRRSGSERKNMKRAASVPVGQQESSGLGSESRRAIVEILRSKKQTQQTPPGLPSVVSARGRKRSASSRVTSQVDRVASTPVEEQASSSEQRPRKRHKRSSSTPPAPRPSQSSTVLRSRRHSRSTVRSLATDVAYVPPSRISARLFLRKIPGYPYMNNCSSDIYMHLADPNNAGNLLGEPPAGSIILSTPSENIGSQSERRSRGRRRNAVDLTDENTRRDLMAEWARMRQYQGTLPPGSGENSCSTRNPFCGSKQDDEPISSVQLEATERSPLGANPIENEATTTDFSQSQQTTFDRFLRDSSLAQVDSVNALTVGPDASGEKIDHDNLTRLSDDGIEQPITLTLGVEPPSASTANSHVVKGPPGKLGFPEFSSPSCTVPLSQSNSVHFGHANLARLALHEQTGVATLTDQSDSHLVAFDTGNDQLDAEGEFHMLDIPEIFTFPWVPVSSHLYVPPTLGTLISGMREQLMMQARARRRAEQLYQAELSRRISAEQIIRDLRLELEAIWMDKSTDNLRPRQLGRETRLWDKDSTCTPKQS